MFELAIQLASQIRNAITLHLEYAKYVTIGDAEEAGTTDCSICYEKLRRPVQLVCSHMFCEDCMCEWLDRELTCPICRARLASARTPKPEYLDGSTSLIPQLL